MTKNDIMHLERMRGIMARWKKWKSCAEIISEIEKLESVIDQKLVLATKPIRVPAQKQPSNVRTYREGKLVEA